MRLWPPSSLLLSSSSPSVRILVAARSFCTMTMSSRPHYRGGRYRGYCDRSAVGEGKNVAGNSHLNQGRGRGFNSGFRQVNGGGGYVDSRSYGYNNVSSNVQFNPMPPQFQQNRQPQFQHNRQGAYVNKQTGQPNQFRPRNSKPLDFREWEYVKPEPPHHWEQFTILSYNILADYLANEHWRKLYFHIPRHMLSWEWRKNNLFYELRLWSSDIMCFQEVDRFQELEAEFERQGYDGIHKMRTGNPVDGCSVFWRASKFKLVHEESIEFNKLGLRDNVAQICVLESVQGSLMANPSASDISAAGPNRVVVCNIHVLYNPKRGDIKLGQVRVLLDKADAVSKTWDNAPVVVCGDFNCTPKSPLYNYILEQKLELSDLARDKISGQASAEIRAPIFHKPSPGNQAPTYMQPSTTNVTLNSDAVKNDSHLDSQKHIITSGTVDDFQGQPQLVNPEEQNGTKTKTSKRKLHSVTSETVEDFQGRLQPVNADQPNGTRILAGKLSVCDFQDVRNAIKNTPRPPPLSAGPNITPLKSNKIETDNTHGASSDAISLMKPDGAGTITAGNHIPQSAEKTGCVTETGIPVFKEPAIFSGENEDIGEDGETFLSELTRESLNSEYSHLEMAEPAEEQQVHNLSPEIEPSSSQRTGYNPSLWTRTEIETATGNGDCTSVGHPLQLSSTYSETEDLLGTRDSNGEPLITSYNRCFCGTVDYIWRSDGLQTVKVLAPMRKQAMQWTAGFPTKKWGSDHIALVAQLAFVQGSEEDHSD